jgi:hypothetical protein
VIALALASLLAVAPTSGAVAVDACAGTLDRTPECAGPADTALVVTNDTKPQPPAPAVRDPILIPAEIAFIGVGFGVLGAATLVATQVEWNSSPSKEEQMARIGGRYVGGVAVGASAALFASALALWVFDPSTGKMRFTIDGGD